MTIAAVILSAAAGAWITVDPLSPLPYFALPAVLFIRMALNAIDGMLAREFGMQSPLGGILNEMGDVVSDAVLYLPLGFHPSVPWWAIIAVVIMGVMVEMVGVVGVQVGASRRYDGPFGKSDRALAFGSLGLLFGLGISGQRWVFWFSVAAAVLSALTVINRGRKALQELETSD